MRLAFLGGLVCAWIWVSCGSQQLPEVTQQGGALRGSGGVGTPGLGAAIAISSDGATIVAGAPFDSYNIGAAWVFAKVDGRWTQQGAKLVGQGAEGPGYFGRSVAISGDGRTIVCGAPLDGVPRGAVWVFRLQGAAWVQDGSKLVAAEATAQAGFGREVALSYDGLTLAVGAPYDSNNAGGVWVFARSEAGWRQQGGKVLGSGASGSTYQGSSISLTPDAALLASGGSNDAGGFGATWVFARQPGGSWLQLGPRLVGSGGQEGIAQGPISSVAFSADGATLAVNSYGDASDAGVTWLFACSDGRCNQSGDAIGIAGSGQSMALSASGEVLAVGASFDGTPFGTTALFSRTPVSGWALAVGSVAAEGELSGGPSDFPLALALSGDGGTLAVGKHYDFAYDGAVWVFGYSAAGAPGAPCARRSDCLSSSCVAGVCQCNLFCSGVTCPGSCPSPLACVGRSDGTTSCLERNATGAAPGAACSDGSGCLSGLCAGGVCGCSFCRLDDLACPAGCDAPEICTTDTTGGSVCALPGAVRAGSECARGSDCASGRCNGVCSCAVCPAASSCASGCTDPLVCTFHDPLDSSCDPLEAAAPQPVIPPPVPPASTHGGLAAGVIAAIACASAAAALLALSAALVLARRRRRRHLMRAAEGGGGSTGPHTRSGFDVKRSTDMSPEMNDRSSGDADTPQASFKALGCASASAAAAAAAEDVTRAVVRGCAAERWREQLSVLQEQLVEVIRRDHALLGRLKLVPADQRSGGQGLVHFATDIDDPSKQLAVKFFLKAHSFATERRHFANDSLRHLLPPVHEMTGNEDGALQVLGKPLPPMVVMERGEPLNEWARRLQPNAALNFFNCLNIVTHLVQRVGELHAAGLAHRDLKPGNIILLPSRNEWTVIDYGIAAPLGQAASIGFSLCYAAPETLRAWLAGQSTIVVDAAVDVWALGLVAYELLTLSKVFQARDAKLVHRTMLGELQLPWEDERRPQFAADMRALGFMKPMILRMLAREPELRVTLAEVDAAWSSFLHRGDTSARGAPTPADAARV